LKRLRASLIATLRGLDRVDLAVGALLVVGPIVLLLLSLGMTFFGDEWEFIRLRSLSDPANWFVPHNEHWSTLPIIVYRSLVETVGLRTYVPYIALVLILHTVVVLLIYRLVRLASGPLAGGAVAVVAMYFGSGADNLFWGFQIGAVGATALCLAALLVLEGQASIRSAGIVLGLLLIALATHGIAMPMVVAIGVSIAVRRSWRPFFPIVLVGVAVYAGWFELVGSRGIGVQGDPVSVTAALRVPVAILVGVSTAASAWTGLPPLFGVLPAAAMLALAAYRASKGPFPHRFAACLSGLVVFYGLVGLTRAVGGAAAAEASHLTYFGGALFVVGAASVIGSVDLPSQTRQRLPLTALISVIATLCVSWNLFGLAYARQFSLDWADITRAWIVVELRESAATAPIVSSDQWLPERAGLLRLLERYGSPLDDPFAPPPTPVALMKVERYFMNGFPWPVPG
jgi:hypothetical protein